jgi:hypothetical protein
MLTALWVIALRAARMAAPSDVPPAALSWLTAVSALVWSALGAAVSRPPCSNATTPMSTEPGWALMKPRAAVSAAPSRLGATSVAVMLPETSIARITVPLACVTGTFTDGPPAPTASTASPARVSGRPAARPRRRPRPVPSGPVPGGPVPDAASAAARHRVLTTAAQASAATTIRATASRMGSANFIRACAGCLR